MVFIVARARRKAHVIQRGSIVMVAGICLVLSMGLLAQAEPSHDVLSQIDEMAALDAKPQPSLGRSIAEKIERDPKSIADAMLKKLDDQSLSNKQLTVYVWALGLTRDPRAVNPLISLYKRNTDENVGVNCLHALAAVGGTEPAAFLLATLEQAADRTERSAILNLLGQMQVAEALPKTEELLKLDLKSNYWESIFVFG